LRRRVQYVERHCAQCQRVIPESVLLRRHYSHERLRRGLFFCGRPCQVAYMTASGHQKAASDAGRERRIAAVKLSNRLHPRRRKKLP
jgi:hypothetical protein